MDEARERRRGADRPPADPTPEVPADTPPGAGGTPGSGTGLRRPDESDPYGLQVKGAGDIVHSDLVGAAELSAEYTAGQAADDTATDVDEAAEAWDDAADESLRGE